MGKQPYRTQKYIISWLLALSNEPSQAALLRSPVLTAIA